MYRDELLPYWIMVTPFTAKKINKSCPADLEPYAKAHERKVKEADFLMWIQGQYNRDAIQSTIGNAFLKKGQEPNKYPSKPVMEESEFEGKKPQYDENGEMILTEEEKKMWRKRLLTMLKIKQANFEANKRQGGVR